MRLDFNLDGGVGKDHTKRVAARGTIVVNDAEVVIEADGKRYVVAKLGSKGLEVANLSADEAKREVSKPIPPDSKPPAKLPPDLAKE